MLKIPMPRNILSVPEDCSGTLTGKCLGEVCKHFSTCVGEVLNTTRKEWRIPLALLGDSGEPCGSATE